VSAPSLRLVQAWHEQESHIFSVRHVTLPSTRFTSSCPVACSQQSAAGLQTCPITFWLQWLSMDHPGGVENVAAAIVASYLQPSHEGNAGLSRKGGPRGLWGCGHGKVVRLPSAVSGRPGNQVPMTAPGHRLALECRPSPHLPSRPYSWLGLRWCLGCRQIGHNSGSVCRASGCISGELHTLPGLLDELFQ
jgi:hypothetical protein